MSDKTRAQQPPLGIRVLHALRKEPDWLTMPAEALVAFREAENRRRASGLARVITGFPDRRATIGWQQVALPDRAIAVRVYRPTPTRVGLPLVLHVHGGGFVGTAVQSDWVNSHLAARLPAVVVSVEHRLVGPGMALSAAVDDGWDVLRHVLEHAAQWPLRRSDLDGVRLRLGERAREQPDPHGDPDGAVPPAGRAGRYGCACRVAAVCR